MDKNKRLAFVTYHDNDYGDNLKINLPFIKNFLKCSDHYIYSRDDLVKDKIYYPNKHIFDQSRGAGLWAWKPWSILRALKKIDENQILFYHDCGKGIRFLNLVYPKKILNLAAEKKFLVGVETDIYGSNSRWSHRYLIENVGSYNEFYLQHNVIEAVMSFWTKSSQSFNFLNKWLELCLQESFIADDINYSFKDQHKTFIKHMNDQSILTNLAIKENAPRLKPKYLKSPIIKSITCIEIDEKAKKSKFFFGIVFCLNLFVKIKGFFIRFKK